MLKSNLEQQLHHFNITVKEMPQHQRAMFMMLLNQIVDFVRYSTPITDSEQEYIDEMNEIDTNYKLVKRKIPLN